MGADQDAEDDDDEDDHPTLKVPKDWYTLPLFPLECPSGVVVGLTGREYRSTSCWGLAVTDEPRRSCILVVEWQVFDPFILVVILINCATMAWTSPLDPPGTHKAAFIDLCELFYLAVFTFELVAKIVAYGFVVEHGTYLRDPWCQLDFVVVTLAWVPILIPSFGNYSIIRSVRALRPLRALKRMPGMPVLVNSLLAAIPKLANVAALVGMLFVVLGIIGTEEFEGALHYRCALPGYKETPGHPSMTAEFAASGFEDSHGRRLRTGVANIPTNEFDTTHYCNPNHAEESCAVGTCAYFDENTNHGINSFDNFGWTCIVILQAITFDGWTLSMYGLMTVLDSPLIFSFYLIIVVVGGFFIVNLFLAVLFNEFVDAQAVKQAIEEEKQNAIYIRHKVDAIAREGREKTFASMFQRWRDSAEAARIVSNFNRSHNPVARAFLSWRGTRDPEKIEHARKLARFMRYWALGTFAAIFNGWVEAVKMAKAERAAEAQAIADAAAAAAARAPAAIAASVLLKASEVLCIDGWVRRWLGICLGVELKGTRESDDNNGLLVASDTSRSDSADVDEDGERRRRSLVQACCECAPPVDSWRAELAWFVSTAEFSNVATTLVLLNLVIMAMPYYGMPPDYAAQLETASSTITWLFIVEFALKLTAFGCSHYWSDVWNVLDGTIVTMSILEMVVTYMLAGEGIKFSFLRALRLLRLLRMLRLMRSWKGLYKVIVTIGEALPQMTNVFILLFLIIMIFALLGMQLFGGQFNEANGYGLPPLLPLPRYNFDYFVPAMLTCFVLATGGWYNPMLDGVNALGPAASVYYTAVVIIGTYILMNLLVAVLLYLFSQSQEEPARLSYQAKGSADPIYRDEDSVLQEGVLSTISSQDGLGVQPKRFARRNAVDRGDEDHALGCGRGTGLPPYHPFRKACLWLIERPETDTFLVFAVIVSSLMLAFESPRLETSSELHRLLNLSNIAFTFIFCLEALGKSIAYGFAFTPNAYLKRSSWNTLDFALVLISIAALIADEFPQLAVLRPLRVLRVLRPLRIISRNAGMKLVLSSLFEALPAVSNVFGVMFGLQTVFAIIGMQLYSGAFQACTDVTIAEPARCTGFIGVPSPTPMLPPAPPPVPPWPPSPPLRPSPTPPLPISSAAVEASAAPLDATVRTSSTRMAKRLLKGSTVAGEFVPGPGGSMVLIGSARRWQNPPFGSFDNFGSAMLLLLMCATGDDWDQVMYWAMDSIGPGEARVRNDSGSACIFFIMWMFVGSLFAMQLFVGVVVDQFNKIRANKSGTATMTLAQKQWVNTIRTMSKDRGAKAKAIPGDGAFAIALFELAMSPTFQMFITATIVANLLALISSDRWGVPAESLYAHVPAVLQACNAVFYGEALLKVRAFGMRFYVRDEWCRFEGLLVLFTLLSEPAVLVYVPLPGLLVRSLLATRALRALRLVQYAAGLHDLVITILTSLPSLGNVTSILALVVYIYSVLGVQFFTLVRRGVFFNDERNFDSFGHALLVTFQCLTGDGWASMMNEIRVDESHPYSHLSVPYFVSFQYICSSVILNLVVAVILENFTSLGTNNSDLVSRSDIERFRDVWADFDPVATQKITVRQLPELIRKLPQPLGLPGAPQAWVARMCLNLGLESEHGKLKFRDVLTTLIRFNYQQMMSDELPPPDSFVINGRGYGGVAENDDSFVYAKQTTGTSLLWASGELTEGQRATAKILTLMLLRHSHGTSEFRRIIALPRSIRIEQYRKAQQANRVLSRFERWSPSFKVADLEAGSDATMQSARHAQLPADPGNSDTKDALRAASTLFVQAQGRIDALNSRMAEAAAANDAATLSTLHNKVNALTSTLSHVEQLISAPTPRWDAERLVSIPPPNPVPAAVLERGIPALESQQPRACAEELSESGAFPVELSPGEADATKLQAGPALRVRDSYLPASRSPVNELLGDKVMLGEPIITSPLTLVLEGSLEEFTSDMEAEFLAKLAAYGGVAVDRLSVVGKRAGSIILEVEVLHSDDAGAAALAFVRKVVSSDVAELSRATSQPVRAVQHGRMMRDAAYADVAHARQGASGSAKEAVKMSLSASENTAAQQIGPGEAGQNVRSSLEDEDVAARAVEVERVKEEAMHRRVEEEAARRVEEEAARRVEEEAARRVEEEAAQRVEEEAARAKEEARRTAADAEAKRAEAKARSAKEEAMRRRMDEEAALAKQAAMQRAEEALARELEENAARAEKARQTEEARQRAEALQRARAEAARKEEEEAAAARTAWIEAEAMRRAEAEAFASEMQAPVTSVPAQIERSSEILEAGPPAVERRDANALPPQEVAPAAVDTSTLDASVAIEPALPLADAATDGDLEMTKVTHVTTTTVIRRSSLPMMEQASEYAHHRIEGTSTLMSPGAMPPVAGGHGKSRATKSPPHRVPKQEGLGTSARDDFLQRLERAEEHDAATAAMAATVGVALVSEPSSSQRRSPDMARDRYIRHLRRECGRECGLCGLQNPFALRNASSLPPLEHREPP